MCTGQNASKSSCTTGAAWVKIRLQEPAKIWVAVKEVKLSYYNPETLVSTIYPVYGGEKDKRQGAWHVVSMLSLLLCKLHLKKFQVGIFPHISLT